MNLTIKRVLQLPGTLDASTMYIVRSNESGMAELYFTNNDGSAVRRLPTKTDIQAMLDAHTAGGANQLTTPRDITITGDATWTVEFDGSADVSAVLTLADTGIAAGEYVVTTVDSKGRTTAGRNLTANDVPSIPGSKISSAISVDTTGNAATASSAAKLTTARTINGVAFDGTANITVPAEDTATPRIAVSEKGVANGVATLDAQGLVPASQLPSYVDDVIEVANFAALPGTGEASKIYVTLDDNKVFRWTGSIYVQIPSGVGTADSAVKLVTPRTIASTGDVTWSVTFDGSANVSGAATLANSGIAAGEHAVATYDAKGRAVSGRALVAADIPTLDYTKVVSAQSVYMPASEW